MEDIYLIPIRLKPLNFTIQNIYLKDIYYIYPKEYEEKIGNICICLLYTSTTWSVTSFLTVNNV